MVFFSLTLLLGTGLGVVLQKYGDVSGRSADLLRKLGIYHYFYGPTAALKAPFTRPLIPLEQQGRLKLYVLVGQSNMVGTAETPADVKPSANIYTFGNDYQWKAARPAVDSAENQVDQVSADPEAAFGPALPFAQALIAQNNNQIIGLIPCAKNGSSITDWQRSLSDQSLYGSCLKRVRAASTIGTVAGILFFQGEADAIDPKQYPSLQPDAAAWAEKFASFAYNFRQDLGNPALPLVYAQLGQPGTLEGLPNWDLVKQQQANLQIPNAALISTSDLPMAGIHFTAEGYQVIGQRFADAIAAFESMPSAPANASSLPAESLPDEALSDESSQPESPEAEIEGESATAETPQ